MVKKTSGKKSVQTWINKTYGELQNCERTQNLWSQVDKLSVSPKHRKRCFCPLFTNHMISNIYWKSLWLHDFTFLTNLFRFLTQLTNIIHWMAPVSPATGQNVGIKELFYIWHVTMIFEHVLPDKCGRWQQIRLSSLTQFPTFSCWPLIVVKEHKYLSV